MGFPVDVRISPLVNKYLFPWFIFIVLIQEYNKAYTLYFDTFVSIISLI